MLFEKPLLPSYQFSLGFTDKKIVNIVLTQEAVALFT